jgi:beta-lactam-binding protein with PASTA domain
LTVGAITTTSSTTVPAGSVISQNPTSGTQVIVGSLVALVVSSGPPTGSDAIAIDQIIFADGRGTQTTSVFSTTAPSGVLIALASSDGPSSGLQTLTVSGAGLQWTLVQRANAQAGTAEVWRATATTPLSNVTVTSTPSQSGFDQSLTVITFVNASAVGASAKQSAATGAASVTLTTTKPSALIFGVGSDWDNAVARTLRTGQTMAHQWVDSAVGDTFWMQMTATKVDNAGTTVTMGVTAPTTDRWNFAVVEVASAATPPPLITVPNVVSLTQSAATSAITSAGLTVGTITTASSTTVPAGSVISQNPAAGTQVTQGSSVALVVSSGPPLVAVPDVVSLTQSAATSAITSAGLTVGTITTASSTTAPAGSVISQNPIAGTQIAQGGAVALVVSSGPPLVAVPDVVTLTQSAATSAITAAGLTIGTITTASSTAVPAGSVISQNPMAGTQVVQGSAVALVISSGPPLVAVPNVVSLTQSAATSAITTAGLAVGTITTAPSTSVPAGSVVSQNPAAATQVAPGTAVAIVVSSGAPPVTIDQTIFSDGRGTRTTAPFNTTVAGQVLVAFAASDGPSTGAQTLTISGAGLQWTLVQRANTQSGTSEIWRAIASAPLTNVTVTSTPALSGYDQSLTVVTFFNASGVGASAKQNASSGAASATLTTTRNGALVFGIGNDWDDAIVRTLSAGQTMVHQWVDSPVGDTFWVQSTAARIDVAGTTVTLGVTAPTSDRWNFAVVEIVP